MSEIQEGTPQQEIYQSVPTKGESSIDFNPLSEEQLKELSGNWSPRLGGRFISVAQGSEEAWDPENDPDLVDTDDRDYGFLNEASCSERSGIEGGDKKEEFKQWVMSSKNPIILKLSGIDNSENIRDEQAELAFQKMISFFDEGRRNVDLEEFISQVGNNFTFEELKDNFSHLVTFCHVFGAHSGTAIAHLTVGERGIDNEGIKNEMVEKGISLTDPEKGLIAVIKDLSQGQAEINHSEDDSGDNGKTGEKTVEGDKLPDYVGGAIIGNRGEKDSKDPRGQDRLFHREIGGDQLFLVTDGAGRKGHQVAEEIGGLLTSKLEENKGDLDEERIKRMLEEIHTEMQDKFGQVSGATVDGLLKTDEGNFVLHVGEGFIGQIKDGKIKYLDGIEPQNFGEENNGKPKRTANGYKTPEIGVDAKVNPVVISGLENDLIILASDGFSDMLPYINFSIEEFNKHLEESPQRAAEFLTNLANAFAQEYHGQLADDVAVMVVDLRKKESSKN